MIVPDGYRSSIPEDIHILGGGCTIIQYRCGERPAWVQVQELHYSFFWGGSQTWSVGYTFSRIMSILTSTIMPIARTLLSIEMLKGRVKWFTPRLLVAFVC